MSDPEPDGYLIEHIRDAIAADPAIGVLGVDVRITGRRLFLTGDAATPERRAAITEKVTALCPEYSIHNEMTVATAAAERGEPEHLS